MNSPGTQDQSLGRSKSIETGLSWTPNDIGLFLRGARADARLADLLNGSASSKKAEQVVRQATALHIRASAFDQLYAETAGDPWLSASPRYRYQARKYDALVSMLPAGRRFPRALDIGCGAGLLTRRLAPVCDSIMAVDISAVAIQYARERNSSLDNISFEQHDILQADSEGWSEAFDLIVIADTIYYLPGEALSDSSLKSMALRFARMLAPCGLLLVANHFFLTIDAASQLTRRIHSALEWSPTLRTVKKSRRAFYLAGLFARTSEREPLSPHIVPAQPHCG